MLTNTLLTSISTGYILLLLLTGSTSASPLPSPHKRHSSGVAYSSRSIPINGALPRSHLPASHGLSKRWYGTDVQLYGPLGGTVYTIPITIGPQNFTVRIDTGSADLWVASSNVTCPAAAEQTYGVTSGTAADTSSSSNDTSLSGLGGLGDVGTPAVNSTQCYFKSPGYDRSSSTTFHPVTPVENYNQSFSGGLASGTTGLDDVTIAGITVPQQQFAIVDIASAVWGNVGTNDGIFGLAQPTVEAVFKGATGVNDSPATRAEYSPWIWNAVNESLIEPYFTIDLAKPTFEQRTQYDNISDYGTLTIGGIPQDVPWDHTTVTVPNAPVPDGVGGVVYYWAVNISSFDFKGSDSIPAANNSVDYGLLDTGTSVSQIPANVAAAYHQSVSPPGILYNETIYLVQCNATMPDFGITVGGTKFTAKGDNFKTGVPYTSPGLDQLGEALLSAGYCYSGIQLGLAGSTTLAIIGDNVLWDVMYVADLEKNEITLIQK